MVPCKTQEGRFLSFGACSLNVVTVSQQTRIEREIEAELAWEALFVHYMWDMQSTVLSQELHAKIV